MFVFGAIPVSQLLDLALNAIAGGVFAYAGSLLISLIRTPMLLDRDSQQAIDEHIATINNLKIELSVRLEITLPL